MENLQFCAASYMHIKVTSSTGVRSNYIHVGKIVVSEAENAILHIE